MELQEWFYNNSWAYYLYWILGSPLMYYSLIFCLKFASTLIIRLPSDGLGDAVVSKQRLRSREEIKKALTMRADD
jgi:hypothetical protein